MEKETTFGINPNQISEIVDHLRKESPDYVWGKGEFRNAIFESLVQQHSLPFNRIGAPDWNDPQVKRLNREYSDFMQRENDIETIDGIEGRCTTEDCDWRTEGQARVEKQDRILNHCDLTEKCSIHHRDSSKRTQHNRFLLFKKDKQVGTASVSSQACTGYIEPL